VERLARECIEARREEACLILDSLGADGTVLAINRTPVGDVEREIHAHVRWLENRAAEFVKQKCADERRALVDALKALQPLAALAAYAGDEPDNRALYHVAGLAPLTWGDVRRAAALLGEGP
jgi:hypothetical protein